MQHRASATTATTVPTIQPMLANRPLEDRDCPPLLNVEVGGREGGESMRIRSPQSAQSDA